MKSLVRYGTDIIVGMMIRSHFRWFISQKELWIMDRKKWARAFMEAGFQVSESDHSERYDIAVLNEDSVLSFIEAANADHVTTEHLTKLLRECENRKSWDGFCHLMPSLFVDFDNRWLISYFSESLAFEKYAPDGWNSEYKSFYEKIPIDDRYWIIDGVDLVSQFQLYNKGA